MLNCNYRICPRRIHGGHTSLGVLGQGRPLAKQELLPLFHVLCSKTYVLIYPRGVLCANERYLSICARLLFLHPPTTRMSVSVTWNWIWELNLNCEKWMWRYIESLIFSEDHILLDFGSKRINSISNYTIQIQFFNAIIQIKQYNFKLCDSNSVFQCNYSSLAIQIQI